MSEELTLLPQPRQVELTGGTLAAGALVIRSEFDGELVDTGLRFVKAVCEGHGKNETPLTIRNAPDDVAAALAGACDPEAYALEVAPGGITLCAGAEVGVLRGLTTLSQLLQRPAEESVPCCKIADAPDMAQRGIFFNWGMGHQKWLPGEIRTYFDRLAQIKMNAVCFQLLSTRGVVFESERFPAGAPDDIIARTAGLVAEIKARGFKVFGYVPHMDGLSSWDSQIVGDIVSYSGERRGICFSRPDTREILLDVAAEMASALPLDGISFWLEEIQDGCRCDECMQVERFVRHCDAINYVSENLPQRLGRTFPIRVLLSQGSYKYNRAIIERLPKAVTLEYYFGDLYGEEVRSTYNYTDPNIVPQHVKDLAAAGYRFVAVPNYTGQWGSSGYPIVMPNLVAGKVADSYDNGLIGSTGWCPWPNASWHNLATAAAVAWNANDREIARILQRSGRLDGRSDPEAYADLLLKAEPLSCFTAYITSLMWNSPLRNAIPAMGQRMATLFVPDHLDLEYADYLYQQVMPTLRQDIAEAWEAAEIAARIKEKWIEAVTRATALFGEVLLGWYRAYYVYVRERDIDTFAGSWGNWRDEVRACFDDVSKAYNEFAELWPEVMKHGDTETPCKLAFAQSAMGGVKRALMMIERPGFEPRL